MPNVTEIFRSHGPSPEVHWLTTGECRIINVYMSVGESFFFALFMITALGVLFGMHLIVFRYLIRIAPVGPTTFRVLLVVFPLSYILASFLIRFWYTGLTRLFFITASVWLGVLFILFTLFAVYSIISFLFHVEHIAAIWAIVVLGCALSGYGILNARSFSVRHISIPLPGLSDPRTIVHLSDIHIGTVNGAAYLSKIVAATNAANPDMTLITGDLFDGSGPIVPETLSSFNDLSAPAVFSIGNHEYYEGLDTVRTVLSGTPLVLLEDATTTIAGVQIIGVSDPSVRKNDVSLYDVLAEIRTDPSKPTILMYHQPKDLQAVSSFDIDLVLSGHTHNGQIFPFGLLVRLFYPQIHGVYELDGSYVHTSAGTGTWGPPMRIGSRSEVTVLHLVPDTKE